MRVKDVKTFFGGWLVFLRRFVGRGQLVHGWLWLTVGMALVSFGAENDAELAAVLTPWLEAHQGRVSVAIRQPSSGVAFWYRADDVMPTASLIKVAVMVEAYRQAHTGRLDLTKMLELRPQDRVPGSGILTEHFSPGLRLSLRDAIHLMIAFSDNTATNMVLEQTGLESVAQTMESLGLRETKVHALVFRPETSIFPERSREYGLGSTTAREMVTLLELIESGKVISEPACRQIVEHLQACQDRTKLARHLPASVKFAHKTGAVGHIRCDAGILFTSSGPVMVAVLTANNSDQRGTQDNAADVLCGRIGQVVFARFHRDTDQAGPSYYPLRRGASGPLVRDLQRTLNGKLHPSPQLAEDGEFGPATEAAVRQFQAQHGLPVTGIMERADWQALGPLWPESAPNVDVEQFNAARAAKLPAESVAGPPIVTCPAWIVMEQKTGHVMAEHNSRIARDTASTTKIMTAYVVLKLAEEHPSVFDEVITFSEQAARVPGSSCGLRPGEQVTVRELLYGLLLPSGNDAAQALAEHIGRRLLDLQKRDGDPVQAFVEHMNGVAAELGLSATRFRNAHGLSTPEHHSSAYDLAVLTRHAMNLPVFASYVATRQRACRISGPGGYERTVIWKNTNRLLDITGYDGVKTGTTSAAGACLVSSWQHEGRRWICVVLGSTSSDARYTDTRNLLRWAAATASASK